MTIRNFYDYSDIDSEAEQDDEIEDPELDFDFENFDWWDDEKEVYWTEFSYRKYTSDRWEAEWESYREDG